jgi:hypothetical protein
MARYEDHISSVIKSTEAICGSCGRFIEQQVFRLPSADLILVDKIKVIWFGDGTPTANDLKPYLEVRKHVVLRALRWLRLHNKLYSHIAVNEALLNLWEDSFIPRDLEESIVHSESDHDEREGYATNLRAGNHENDFQEALDGQSSAPISTGCVYTDVESSRQHPTLQLMSAILNLEKGRLERDAPHRTAGEEGGPRYIDDVPVIRYVSRGRSVLMIMTGRIRNFLPGPFPPS